jgi:hypothetical protein
MLKVATSPEMLKKPHGDLEEWARMEGKELLRLVVQTNLDLRTEQEEQLPVIIGTDGLERNHHRNNCLRGVETLFGKVNVRRIGYNQRNVSSLFPLDAELNLPSDIYSHGLRRLTAQEVATNSYEETMASIERSTGCKIPKLQAEELAAKVSQDFETFYESRQVKMAENTKDLLVMSLDGKGIVMRPEGLREATKKAAEKEKNTTKMRLSSTARPNRKRMATVAAIYTAPKHERTAETIMKKETAVATTVRPHISNKRVWASVERDHVTVVEELFKEAVRRDPERSRQWTMLVDGHEQQLKNIWKHIKKYTAQHTIIVLDFVHVLEYVWQAARALYPKNGELAEKWVSQRALLILQGKASNVAGGMRRSANLRKLSAAARKTVNTTAGYLLKYKHYIRYDKFLAAGLPIATGVIEGACRHLIKDRLDITGARWGLAGAEAVLKLRSLHVSHDFEKYWQFHMAQELQRNHSAHYANNSLCLAA